jgi:hypothetical protein
MKPSNCPNYRPAPRQRVAFSFTVCFPFTFGTHILHIHICFWSQCLSIHFTRMGKPLQKHKPNTIGYVTRLLHGRKHTNTPDMIWKNTLNSALILKQHYKHGALFFLFSIHADFKIVRQYASMHPELHKHNFNDWSLPQKCSVWGFDSARRLKAIRHHGEVNRHMTTAAARDP